MGLHLQQHTSTYACSIAVHNSRYWDSYQTLEIIVNFSMTHLLSLLLSVFEARYKVGQQCFSLHDLRTCCIIIIIICLNWKRFSIKPLVQHLNCVLIENDLFKDGCKWK